MNNTNTSELQTRLKVETLEYHKQAENHPVMQSFVSGSYKEEHLLSFLVNILPIYQVVEQRLLPISIDKNNDLHRSFLIKKDIDALSPTFKSSDVYEKIITPFNLTRAQVSKDWLKDQDLLKSNLYVRWLADFYGGRILAKSLAPYDNMYKAYNPGDVIKDVREIVDMPNKYITNDVIIAETKAFFTFHVELFDLIQKC